MELNKTADVVVGQFAGREYALSARLGDDHIVRQVRATGTLYEQELLSVLLKMRPPEGAYAADVGAHIGNHTVAFAGAFGLHTVSIEPDQQLADELRRTIMLNRLDPLVTLEQVAAWSVSDKRLVYVSGPESNRGQGRVLAADDGEHATSSSTVTTRTVDDIFQARKPLWLLKIDVEGSELEVLAGARRTIARDHPIIVVEVHQWADAVQIQEVLGGDYRLQAALGQTPALIFRADEPIESNLSALAWSVLQRALIDMQQANKLEVARNAVMATEHAMRSSSAKLTKRIDDTENRLRVTVDSQAREREEVQRALSRIQADLARSQKADTEVAELRDYVTQSMSENSELQRRVAELQRTIEEHADRLNQLYSLEERRVQQEQDRRRRAQLESLMMAIERDIAIISKLDSARSLRAARLIKQAALGPKRATAVKALFTLRSNVVEGRQYAGYQSRALALARQLAAPARQKPPSETKAPRTSSTKHALAPSADQTPSAAPHTQIAKPLISVIVAAYNVEQYLTDAIHSLMNQTYRNLEILIVNDCSTDNTLSIAFQLAEKDSRIRVMSTVTNVGSYACRNIGIEAAKGELVTFQDGDDMSEPTRIERQFEALMASEKVRASACDYVRMNRAGEIVLNRGLAKRLCMISVLIRRKDLDAIGRFDTVRMSGDAEFYARIKAKWGGSAVTLVREPLYKALVREGSVTSVAGGEARLGSDPDDRGKSVREFLSDSRVAYMEAYESWHRNSKNLSLPFPLRDRPFPASRLHLRDVPQPSRVVAGMATYSRRKALLPAVLQSVAPQVDLLYVHLNDYDELPADAQGIPNIVVSSCWEHGNLLDSGKFLALGKLDQPSYFLSLDDDIVYPPDYVRRMLACLEQFGRRAVIGVHGVVLAEPLERFYVNRTVAHFAKALQYRKFADIVGTGTMAMHSSMLTVGLEDFRLHGMADLWFAIACRRAGVPRVVIDRPHHWLKPLPVEEDIFSSGSIEDSAQTKIAHEHGPWGPSAVALEVERWQAALPDALPADLYWKSLGFESGSPFTLALR